MTNVSLCYRPLASDDRFDERDGDALLVQSALLAGPTRTPTPAGFGVPANSELVYNLNLQVKALRQSSGDEEVDARSNELLYPWVSLGVPDLVASALAGGTRDAVVAQRWLDAQGELGGSSSAKQVPPPNETIVVHPAGLPPALDVFQPAFQMSEADYESAEQQVERSSGRKLPWRCRGGDQGCGDGGHCFPYSKLLTGAWGREQLLRLSTPPLREPGTHRRAESFSAQQELSVLQIGVCFGQSLPALYQFFSSYFGGVTKITGADIDLTRWQHFGEQRFGKFEPLLPEMLGGQDAPSISVVQLDSTSELSARTAFFSQPTNAWRQHDLLIDDGGHSPAQIARTFLNLFLKVLKPGGLYVIEDTNVLYLIPDRLAFVNWLVSASVFRHRMVEVGAGGAGEAETDGVVRETDPLSTSSPDFDFIGPSRASVEASRRSLDDTDVETDNNLPEPIFRRTMGVYRRAFAYDFRHKTLKSNERHESLMSMTRDMGDQVLKSISPYFAWIQNVEVEGYFITIRKRKCLVGSAGCKLG